MWNRILAHRDLDHRLLRRLRSLANRFGNFIRLAKTAADFIAAAISRHNQCAETKTPSTFHDLRASVDENHLFGDVRFLGRRLLPISASAWSLPLMFSHRLKFESSFARRVRQRFDFAVIKETAA